MFLLQGDKIALKSIKCVEFRIAHNDVVKRDRMPFVMDDFRYSTFSGIYNYSNSVTFHHVL